MRAARNGANKGSLENAQAMAAHESPRSTKLYDRTSDEITLDEVERITDRRELALELFQEMNSAPRRFPLTASLRDDPDEVGRALREFLDVDAANQRQAARQGRAFDYWRRRLEEKDV